VPVLKGCIHSLKDDTYRGVKNVEHLWYICPGHNNHSCCIPITEGPSCNSADGKPIWHYEMKDGLVVVTPSINSQGHCVYHDFYSFQIVPESEIPD
jgi:hypothetical protein